MVWNPANSCKHGTWLLNQLANEFQSGYDVVDR